MDIQTIIIAALVAAVVLKLLKASFKLILTAAAIGLVIYIADTVLPTIF